MKNTQHRFITKMQSVPTSLLLELAEVHKNYVRQTNLILEQLLPLELPKVAAAASASVVDSSDDLEKLIDELLATPIAAAAPVQATAAKTPSGTLADRSTLPQSAGISMVGRAGEKFVRDILEKEFGEVIDCSSKTASGDLTLVIGQHNILVEVKTYSRTVPLTEIEKFHRDVESNHAQGAILISLTAPLAGRAKFVLTDEGVPTLYLCSKDPDVIANATRMLVHQVKTKSNQRIGASGCDAKLVTLAKSAKDVLVDLLQFKRAFLEHAETNNGALIKMTNRYSASLSTMSMLFNLIDGTIEENAAQVIITGSIPSKFINDDNREMVGKITAAIEASTPVLKPEWKVKGAVIVNSQTGFGFRFLKKQALFTAPLLIFSGDYLRWTLLKYPGQIKLSSSNFVMKLNEETIDEAVRIISGNMLVLQN